MALVKKKAAASGAKYRGIIISIVVFLLLILAILGLNLYSTLQINKNERTVNTTAQMRDLTQSITRDLFSMKLSYGYDPHSPYSQATLQRLKNNERKFTSDLKALDTGGMIEDYAGNSVDVELLTIPQERQYLRTVAQQWVIFSENIKSYIPTATDTAADSTELDLAVLQAEESSIVIYDALDSLVNSLRNRSEEQANLLRLVQIIGIVLVIVYFVIFMFYFMRKLKAADKTANAARRETDKIMATVNEGLCLVNKDLNIGVQYSKRLESLIGQDNIANRNFSNLLSSIVSKKDMETSEKFISQLFNKKVKEKLVQDLNPLDEVRASVIEKKGNVTERYLKFNFSRVYDDTNNDVDAILVSIADNTRAVELEKRLENEQKYNQQQVDMLASILHTDNESMMDFISNTKGRLDTVNDILRDSKLSKSDLNKKVEAIYREIHSLKGESSILGLEKFVQLAHESEDQLKKLQDNPNKTGNDFLPLTISVDKLMESFQSIQEVNTMLQQRGSVSDDSEEQSQGSQQKSNSYFLKATQDIAEREEKRVSFNGNSINDELLKGKRGQAVKDIATQLIRNAVVHGVESPEQRSLAGKPGQAEVKMTLVKKDKEHGMLVITDDGAGIDFENIRQKLVAKGTHTEKEASQLDKKALVKEIFKSGFSTAGDVTEDAGRGVGLNIVLNSVKALDGNLSVKSEHGSYTRFSIVYSLS